MTASLSSGRYDNNYDTSEPNLKSNCGLSHLIEVSPGSAFITCVIAAALSAAQMVTFMKLRVLKRVRIQVFHVTDGSV